jgi:peroxiredoxin
VSNPPAAPAWQVTQWFNTESAPSLASLRGRVIVLHAFQMLCPGCVLHGVPQAERLHQQFAGEGVAVVGLHTVFEHHEAMQPVSLQAFLHEFRVTHPVGVDAAVPGQRIPATMHAYGMQGTPTLVLIDRAGRIRRQYFGRVEDLTAGAEVMRLLCEAC